MGGFRYEEEIATVEGEPGNCLLGAYTSQPLDTATAELRGSPDHKGIHMPGRDISSLSCVGNYWYPVLPWVLAAMF